MARPKKGSSTMQISLTPNVREVLDQDSNSFGVSASAYISQLIMQKHLEMMASGLLSKMTSEQIQMAIDEQFKKGASD